MWTYAISARRPDYAPALSTTADPQSQTRVDHRLVWHCHASACLSSCLRRSQTLPCWLSDDKICRGQNDDFRCGVAGQPVITQPTVVSSGTSDFQVVQPRAGRTHSAAIDTAGQVLVWGSGSHGKLGHASSRSVDSPLALSQLPSLCQAACGHQHTLLLDRQGSVWSCGENKEVR